MGDGHHHPHGPSSVGTDRRALILALALLVGFMAFEVGAAVVSNSLVLLADAGHMLVDVGAIAGSLIAIRLAARPETGSHTYGMKRAEILAAAANGIALLIVSALVTYDAVVRLVHPSHVDGAVLIVVAAVLDPEVDDLAAFAGAERGHALANLPVGIRAVLVEQRGCDLDFERLIVQQIDCGRGRNGSAGHEFGGGRCQFLAAAHQVRTRVGILDQRRRRPHILHQQVVDVVAPAVVARANFFPQLAKRISIRVVGGIARRFLQALP